MPDQAELTIQGWGPAAAHGDQELSKPARRYLTRELGWAPRETPAVPVEEIRLKPSRLSADVVSALTDLLGEENLRTDRESRLRHAGGKSYLDLLRRRAGDASEASPARCRSRSR